jgi:nucleotide-binding universal stress UspA family protein
MALKILIPLDGSKTGETALPYVEGLVSKLSPRVKAELTLLRVISFLTHYVAAGELMAPISYTEQEMGQIRQRARNYLNKVAKGIKSKKVSVKIKVGIGNAAEEIIKAADEIDVDLIAMSTHGRHGISRWAFGSVTDKVLRGGHKPMLTVRVSKEAAKT